MHKSTMLTFLAVLVGMPAIMLAPLALHVETPNPLFVLVGLISSGIAFGLMIWSVKEFIMEI